MDLKARTTSSSQAQGETKPLGRVQPPGSTASLAKGEKVYALIPDGYPWCSVVGRSGLADEAVRQMAVEAQSKAADETTPEMIFPVDPHGYVRALATAQVRAFPNAEAATQAEGKHLGALRARAECLGKMLEGRSALKPASWVGAVVREVVAAMGVDGEGAKGRLGGRGVPNEWEVPVPVDGPAGLHVRTAIALVAEAIWLHCNEAPILGTRRVDLSRLPDSLRIHPRGRDNLLAWAGSHPKFQGFFEARKEQWPNETELAVLETAYEDFLDRVGEKVVVSLSSGAGNLNPAIPLDANGEPAAHAWPGGYPMYYLTADSSLLSPEAVRDNLERTNDPDDPQWFVVASDINYEDVDLTCDHTNQPTSITKTWTSPATTPTSGSRRPTGASTETPGGELRET